MLAQDGDQERYAFSDGYDTLWSDARAGRRAEKQEVSHDELVEMLLANGAASRGALAQPADKPTSRLPEPERVRGDGRIVKVVLIDSEFGSDHSQPLAQALPNLFAYLQTVPDLDLQGQWHRRSLLDPPTAGREVTLLYMTGSYSNLRLNDAEKTSLGRLLQQGVLLFADDIRWGTTTGLVEAGAGKEGTPFDLGFKVLVRDPLVLGEQGKQWEKVPRSHPLYSCYYEFPDGPPRGGAPGGNVTDLEMLQLRGRPAVIFSDLNISWYWGDPRCGNRERGLQFGVNLLVFALTQGLAP